MNQVQKGARIKTRPSSVQGRILMEEFFCRVQVISRHHFVIETETFESKLFHYLDSVYPSEFIPNNYLLSSVKCILCQ